MNLAAISARLAASNIAAKGLSSLLRMKDEPPQSFPALYVAPERETAQPASAISGVHDQYVTCDFMVAIYIDTKKVTLDQELADIRQQLQDALVGWVHPDAQGFTTEYLGGQLFEIADARFCWFERFRTQRRIRKAVSQ